MLLHHFEHLAKDTWLTLRDASTYDVSQGEETITDNLLLHLVRQNLPDLLVIKTPKNLESEKGTDWEWWIGSRSRGFLRYAVQAKKLDGSNHRYSKLNHVVGKIPTQEYQHVVLKKYAAANQAIPLFALYNHIALPNYHSYWQCPLPQDIEQLGITVTTLKNVETAIALWGKRTFQFLHQHSDTFPLRCLVSCVHALPTMHSKLAHQSTEAGEFKDIQQSARIYSEDEVPFLRLQAPAFLEYFPASLYSTELGIYPKRILVIRRED